MTVPIETAVSAENHSDTTRSPKSQSAICDSASELPSQGGEDRATMVPLRYFGDYELHEEISRGGMGVVYRARQVPLNRRVALKMIRAGRFSSETDIQRLRIEAEAAAQLDHPGIVPIFEVGEHEGLHFFTMAFVDGETLSARLSQGPMVPRTATELILQVVKAIAYAHEKGVIHRDIKPGNILIEKSGQVRVSDFGLARQISTDSELTTTGQVIGTPSFMPPEQARGQIASVNMTSDVYSLGAVFYAALTGRPPFQAASAVETLRQVTDQQPVAPRQLNPSIPRDLETICLRCLEKEPASRYQSAVELAEDLERYLSGYPICAVRASLLEKGWRWACRRPDLSVSLAALGMFVIVGSVAAILQAQQYAKANLLVRAEGLVHPIETAEFRELPQLISELARFTDPSIIQMQFKDRLAVARNEAGKTRIELAAGVLSGQLSDECFRSWLTLPLHDLLIVRQLTNPLRNQYTDFLSNVLTQQAGSADVRSQQLRAACLILDAPDIGKPVTTVRAPGIDVVQKHSLTAEVRWDEIVTTLLQELYENPKEFDSALHLLQPAAGELHDLLIARISEASVSEQQRHLAIALSAELMQDSPEAIAGLACLIEADSLPLVQRHIQRMDSTVVPFLVAEVHRPPLLVQKISEQLDVDAQKKLATEIVQKQADDTRRRAMAAAWLFRLGKTEYVWPLLRKNADSSLRYAVIDRIQSVRGAIGPLLSQLQLAADYASKELPPNPVPELIEITDVGAASELHGIVLLLGGLANDFRGDDREKAIEILVNLFENHPDSGIHSGAEWALRQLDAMSWIRQSHARLLEAGLSDDRNWYLTTSGTTMAVVRGPVVFTMGADQTDPDRLANDSVDPVTGEVTHSDQEPLLQRSIDRDFAIGLKEVSLAEILLFEPDFHQKINQFMSPTLEYPANKINWYLAARYCNWLSEKEGLDASEWCFIPDSMGRYGEGLTLAENYLHRRGYRMPTEAEWEYACRAGTVTPRFFGVCQELFPQYVWYAENSMEKSLIIPGTLKPNDFGLFDVFGNVIEWCIDPYADRPGKQDGIVPDMERGLTADAEAWRVMRGGHLYADEPNIRATDLWTFRPLISDGHYGLRLARTLRTHDKQ